MYKYQWTAEQGGLGKTIASVYMAVYKVHIKQIKIIGNKIDHESPMVQWNVKI